jgi:hypothetical protein
MTIIHRDVSSEKPYAQVIERLEAKLGRYSAEQQAQVAQSSASADQFAQAVAPFIGSSGLTNLMENNHGFWMSKLFKPSSLRRSGHRSGRLLIAAHG